MELTLRVGANTYRFDTLADFEFAMYGRTGLPASKIAALIELSDEALLREADGIRKVEQRFSEVLFRALQGSARVGSFLQKMDLAMISQDNQWRLIIEALNRLDADREGHKRVALAKYVQYLFARQEVIASISAYRQRQNSPRRTHSCDSAHSADLKDTQLFDLTGALELREPWLDRLPKGETIDIPFVRNQAVALRLGRHNFSLVGRDNLRFMGEEGEQYVLVPGRNIIGRDASADVVVNASYKDVSRKHLIIETDGSRIARLTDISSLGTFIPSEYLDRTGL